MKITHFDTWSDFIIFFDKFCSDNKFEKTVLDGAELVRKWNVMTRPMLSLKVSNGEEYAVSFDGMEFSFGYLADHLAEVTREGYYFK